MHPQKEAAHRQLVPL